MHTVIRSCLVAAVLLMGSVSALAAGDASGTVVVMKGGTIAPTHAAAYLTRDPKDARVRIVEVVLSDQPIDAAAAVQALNPHADVINQDALKGRNYVLLWVRSGGEVSMNATFSETMTQYVEVSGGALTASLTANTLDRVAGRLSTAKPISVMDGTSYTVDLTFAADVTRLPPGDKLSGRRRRSGQGLDVVSRCRRRQELAGDPVGLERTRTEVLRGRLPIGCRERGLRAGSDSGLAAESQARGNRAARCAAMSPTSTSKGRCFRARPASTWRG